MHSYSTQRFFIFIFKMFMYLCLLSKIGESISEVKEPMNQYSSILRYCIENVGWQWKKGS
jgi:hypothetical protein